MTTKDYVYLGLILLTALAFYCNGFYAGVYRCKRMYDTLLDDAGTGQESPQLPPQEVKSFAIEDKDLAYRAQDSFLRKREARGNFGHN